MPWTPWSVGLSLALVTLASWAGTAAVLRLLIAWQVFDEPNDRSSHAQAKPRGGGLAVVAVMLAAWIAFALVERSYEVGFWLVLSGALLLAAISWADDLKPRPASLRFGVQVAAVALGLSMLQSTEMVFQGLLPLSVDRALTVLLWLWFINLFNFMDGIDGIAAVETIAISGGLAAIFALVVQSPFGAFLAAVPAAAILGFLPWNWAPSRIFLGDVGSVPLGYLLGGALIGTAASGFWAAALILPLYYLADASLTLARRALRGEKLWQAHREHFYQQAVQRGFSHAAVAGRVAACNLLLVVLAVASAFAPAGLAWIPLGLACLAVVGLLVMLARQAPPQAQAGGHRIRSD
jgi:UDP-N-acetylmuramyl pentapeptide phosphotransferase/UDP-N-acetylglucosamine-1-phosphate transferase